MSLAGRRLHLVGAGGAGMSALAVVAYAWGADVTGCDRAASPALERLRRLGIPAAEGHDPAHLAPGMEVVVSGAVPPDAPERMRAAELGLPVRHRAELLAEIVAARRAVCVGGAHGKTTTTAMIAYAARALGLDPTWLVGGDVPQLGGNAGAGAGDLLVAEADESDGTLTLLSPRIALVTNVELDHHAHYASEAELWDVFARFAAAVPADGAVLLGDGVDLPAGAAPVERFGLFDAADWQVTGLELAPGGSGFWLESPGWPPVHVRLAVPGAHNAVNAAGAIAALAAVDRGLDPGDIADALAGFTGAGRRFERRGEVAGAVVVDGYDHHPTEVAAAISAARAEGPRRVLVCFQPHLFSRTAALAGRFGEALAAADEVVVTEIYPAREAPLEGVTAKLVVDAVCERRPGLPVAYEPTLEGAAGYLRTRIVPGDLVLTLGAGDVRRVGDLLLA